MAQSERVQVLLSGDAALTQQRTPRGNTPLHVVGQARQDDPDFDASVATIELLLHYGADPQATNEGKTPSQGFRQSGMD